MKQKNDPEKMTDKSPVNKKLLAIRDRIDAIDNQILELLSQRAQCAEEVGETKREAGEEDLWFYRPEREAQILNRMVENNPGPLDNERITAIYREIISSCLALEQSIRVAYLGPEGTFSHTAAQRQFGETANYLPCPNLTQVFEQIDSFVAKRKVYLTICTDVFSSAVAPGVSAPQPFGMYPELVLKIAKFIAQSQQLVSFDIAEVSPRFDEDHQTAKLASVMIFAIINNLINPNLNLVVK